MVTGPRPALGWALVPALLVLASAPALADVERPHSLAFKLGYHVYPTSSYFRLSQDAGIGGTQDFRGESLEFFDYTYQWSSRWSLNLLLIGGYYEKFTPTLNSQHSLLVHTMSLIPLYRLAGSDAVGRWQAYGGVGLGRYGMTLRFDFPSGGSEETNTYTLGYIAVVGAEYRYSEHTGFVVEEKFSRARIRFGNELARTEIDVGGHNLLVGVRIHF